MATPALHACLRVNHAGEVGATQLHRGQQWLAPWLAPDCQGWLQEHERAEQQRAWLFLTQLRRLGQAPHPWVAWCEAGGWMLGVFSVLGGKPGLVASTQAMEAVWLDHLRAQRAVCLDAGDLAALACLESVIEDVEHQWRQSEPVDRTAWRYQWVHRVVHHAARQALAWGLATDLNPK